MVVSIFIEAAVLSVAAAVVVVDVAVSTDGLRVSNRVKKNLCILKKDEVNAGLTRQRRTVCMMQGPRVSSFYMFLYSIKDSRQDVQQQANDQSDV